MNRICSSSPRTKAAIRDRRLRVRQRHPASCGHERLLEAEIARKDWSLERAESQTIFNDKSAHPWPALQLRSAAPDSGAWQVLHPVTGP